MLNEYFTKLKQRRALRKYLPTRLQRVYLEAPSIPAPGVQQGRIEFVFVSVRGGSTERVAERAVRVADLGTERGAMVFRAYGQTIIMAFGTFPPAQHSAGARNALVAELRKELGEDVRIVHGAVDGQFGNFGSETRIDYNFTFPRFKETLARLDQMEFGQAQEVCP